MSSVSPPIHIDAGALPTSAAIGCAWPATTGGGAGHDGALAQSVGEIEAIVEPPLGFAPDSEKGPPHRVVEAVIVTGLAIAHAYAAGLVSFPSPCIMTLVLASAGYLTGRSNRATDRGRTGR